MQVTDRERDAIEAVKQAIRKLPTGIWIDINTFEGTVEFWKRRGGGESFGASKPLKCKEKVAS